MLMRISIFDACCGRCATRQVVLPATARGNDAPNKLNVTSKSLSGILSLFIVVYLLFKKENA